MSKPSLHRLSVVAALCLLASSCARWTRPNVGDAADAPTTAIAVASDRCSPAQLFDSALDRALAAAQRSQTATTAADWNAAVVGWLQAIAAMQAIPLDSPQRTFAVKKAAEYERNLIVAQQKAAEAPNPLPFASFDSQFLDEQLRLFLSYAAAVGPPDVLIVGSSRALQGVDPRQLQFSRAQQGQPGLKVFNFGINGATARTVDALLREILAPEQVPPLVIWADGARALNNGRPDRTHQAIAASAGYAALQQGQRPALPAAPAAVTDCLPLTSAVPAARPHARPRRGFAAGLSWLLPPALAAEVRAIDASGFLAVSDRFNPDTYYNRFPRVAGLYDADYQNLSFGGVQQAALARASQTLRSRQIALVFVNLPLSGDYLDATRASAQAEFRTFMTQQAQQQGFQFIDLGLQWRDRNEFFADPSHLNRFGARQIAIQLAATERIPWQQGSAAPSAIPKSTPTPQSSPKATPTTPTPSPSPTPEITLPPPPNE